MPIEFDADLGNSYREMTERLAADPVGQAIVFELMMQIFFTQVLGVRPELIGWRRGNVTKPGEMWQGNGVAADFSEAGCSDQSLQRSARSRHKAAALCIRIS